MIFFVQLLANCDQLHSLLHPMYRVWPQEIHHSMFVAIKTFFYGYLHSPEFERNVGEKQIYNIKSNKPNRKHNKKLKKKNRKAQNQIH